MPSWAIIEKNRQILFIQRSPGTSRGNQWCVPGGGINKEESPEKACIREVKEETGLSVIIKKPILHDKNSYYFLCELTPEDQSIKLKSNECCKYAWVNPPNLLQVGIIMEARVMIPLLTSLGYEVELNEDVRKLFQ